MYNTEMKKKILIVAVILVIIGIGALMYSRKSSLGVAKVEKIPVEQLEVLKTVTASGQVNARNEYDLAFEAGGRINKLYAQKGDLVTAGTLLADAVSNSEYNDIQSLRDARDIAIKDKEIYVETYATKPNAVGGINEYNANLNRFDELISRANANYNSALNSLANLRIIAPVNATVVDVLKETNEVAGGGQTVLKVADLNSLVFKVSVDQEDFGFVKVDQPVLITLDSYKDTTFSGKISNLPLFANSTGDFEVEIALDPAKDAKVLLGMTGDAEIQIDSTQKKVQALSFDAVSEDDKGKYVWIDENSVLKKKYIETGLEGDVYTEVRTTLADTQVVIPTEDTELKEGQTVEYEQSN
jgi:membrane fusion protein (multidrug efflux system)